MLYYGEKPESTLVQKIQLLPDDLCNKIAAGEVIQRPSSVIKELVENSIDAGADDIQVIIRGGGRDEIRISDNGEGMSGDDLLLAFERHATSKIREFADLDTLRSMGFRGEALASIAGIAQVETRSSREDGNGNRLRIEGGKITDFSPFSCAKGTDFTIRHLFYNVPARKKFLKDEATEYRSCLDTVRRFALAWPSIRFTFIHNDREVFRFTEDEAQRRIAALFGHRHAERLQRLDYDHGDLSIHGYLGDPELSRSRTSDQFIFINHRIIMDRRLNGVIYSGYSDVLERGQYPFFLLDISLPPGEIDVNVHPTKSEIKFRHEHALFETLKNVVKSGLRTFLKADAAEAETHSEHSTQDSFPRDGGHPQFQPRAASRQMSLDSFPKNQHSSDFQKDMNIEKRLALFDSSLNTAPSSESSLPDAHLWQAHNQFIFAQVSSGVVVVDQHLAHTRVLYDKALKTLENSRPKGNAQQLLFPLTLDMNPMDFSVLLEIIPSLEKLGFGLRAFGKNSVIIDAVPVDARFVDEGRLLLNILDDYKEWTGKKNPLMHSLALAFSEKTAIRRGDKLSLAEMQSLIDTLFSSENPYYSPRGKTIIINFSLRELGSRFN